MRSDKAHVSINVSDLGRAVEFYRTFLGVAPAKHFKDYAKFELEEPPLVLSLEPIYHRAADSFNHLGLRVSAPSDVVAMQARLEGAGVLAEREDDVECCYSRQTKFWLADPDKNLWEVYALTGDLLHLGNLAASDALAARDRVGRQTVWDHKLGDPLPLPLPHADGAFDEVRLRGTFNTPRPDGEGEAILREALRILAPGGQVMIHGLVAERALPGGFPRLPGPAALVRHTPVESEPIAWLERAGFIGIYVQRLGERPNFEHEDIEMRELMVVAWKPAPAEAAAGTVVYKGPFRSVTDDTGREYRIGERVAIDAATAARLRQGPLADQFAFLRAPRR